MLTNNLIHKLLLMLLLSCSLNAYAYVDCQTKINHVYVGENNDLYVKYGSPGQYSSFRLKEADKRSTRVYAMALTALTNDMRIIVRFVDGNQCYGTNKWSGTEFRGMYIKH